MITPCGQRYATERTFFEHTENCDHCKKHAETERGAIVAKRTWHFIQEQKCVKLVPWNKDPIAQAEYRGKQEVLEMLERFIIRTAQELIADG